MNVYAHRTQYCPRCGWGQDLSAVRCARFLHAAEPPRTCRALLLRGVWYRIARAVATRGVVMAKMQDTVTAHFVTFFSPGTLVAESTERPIASWDVDEAVKMARGIKERHGAVPYGFRFSTRSRGPNDLDSKVSARSGMYYLGGKVETLAAVKARATENDRTLIANMEVNGWDRIVTNDNSWRWTQPLEANDVVLEFTAK